MTYILQNVQVVLQNSIVSAANVWISEGKVMRIDSGDISIPEGEYERIDGGGHLLVPGMIDVHIHGANGFDMMDGTEESIQEVSKACAASGCTSFLATSVSSTMEDLLEMIRSVKRVIGYEVGAKIAGIHLEGPYLNPKRKGMQNEKYLRHPNLEEMKLIFQEAGSLIKMVTIAPELPGGMELLSFLKEQGVVIAIAHSDATYEEAKQALPLGQVMLRIVLMACGRSIIEIRGLWLPLSKRSM